MLIPMNESNKPGEDSLSLFQRETQIATGPKLIHFQSKKKKNMARLVTAVTRNSGIESAPNNQPTSNFSRSYAISKYPALVRQPKFSAQFVLLFNPHWRRRVRRLGWDCYGRHHFFPYLHINTAAMCLEQLPSGSLNSSIISCPVS